MKILVTDAKSFVGRNLCAQLRNIRDGKAENYQISPCASLGRNDNPSAEASVERSLCIEEIFEYDQGTPAELDAFCAEADFVFNLAGVNRPDQGKALLKALRKHENRCPVMVSSSEYGRGAEAVEEMFFEYGEDLNVKMLVYRFPFVFGKWCPPTHDNPVAAFCNGVARGIDIKVPNPEVDLELVYVDDLVDELIGSLRGKEHRCDYDGMGVFPIKDGKYCYVPTRHRATIGEIVDMLGKFEEQRETLIIPEIPAGSFAKKLYTTFLSYLPKEKVAFPLKTTVDAAGTCTDLVRTLAGGQFSVNVTKPGTVTGEHWHNSKWEFYIVISGRARILERCIDSGEVLEFEVSGAEIQAVHMLPGYTHEIINLSASEPLVTIMWANEIFDPKRPDTYAEPV